MSHSHSPTLAAAPAIVPPSWRRDLIWLALLLVVWFGLFLGTRPLSNPDEGRYTEIPREMAASGDFVTPRLDGVKYFEKPPLLYWLSALTIKTIGVHEWSARLWFAIFAVAGGLVTYAAARALFGRAAGWWAAIVLATSLLYYVLSRTAILDLPVAVFIGGALFAFLLGVRAPADSPENRARRRWIFWAFYAAMALAVLTKGLIGFVLPCAVAFVWLLVFNQWKHLRPCHPFTGALILLVIAAPWHILAALANHSPVKEHDFAWFYFVNEHYLRFVTSSGHGRAAPWWLFIAVIIGGFIPWTAFMAQALRANLRGACSWKTRAERASADVWFFITWIVVITLFFSVSQSKLIPYILPVFPAIAVLIGRYIAELRTGVSMPGNAGVPPADEGRPDPRQNFGQGAGRTLSAGGTPALPPNPQSAFRMPHSFRIGLRVAALIAIAFAAALILYPVLQPAKLAGLDITPAWLTGWQVFLGIILGGGGILVAALTTMRRERAALGALIATFGVFMLSANFVAGPFDARSTKNVSLALRDELATNPSAEVYSVGDYFQDAPVYANRLVNIVDGVGELEFGLNAAKFANDEKAASRFINAAEFSRRWQTTSTRAYAIVQKRDAERYFAALPRTVLAENARYMLLVNEDTKPESPKK